MSQVNMKFPPDVRDMLREEAAKAGVSMVQFVRDMIKAKQEKKW